MKAGYIRAALKGLRIDHRLIEAAMVFYHCDMSLEEARSYLKVLQGKLK